MLTVHGVLYRWLVTARNSLLHLTVEAENKPGQVLQAFFEPHSLFKKLRPDGEFCFSRQGRKITPELVARVIRHGLVNHWLPQERNSKPFLIHAWDSDPLAPEAVVPSDGEVALIDLVYEQLNDLCFDISMSPHWRKTLFDAPVGKRLAIPNDDPELSDAAREHDLSFAVFNDGWTPDGFVVFGIGSIEFPHAVSYTTNNPDII